MPKLVQQRCNFDNSCFVLILNRYFLKTPKIIFLVIPNFQISHCLPSILLRRQGSAFQIVRHPHHFILIRIQCAEILRTGDRR